MEKKRSTAAYRGIDLFLFALMLAVFETIIIRAAGSRVFSDQAFTVSLASAITAIVYMRWNAWGGIHAALAGLVYCVALGGGITRYPVYIAGNLFSLLAVPLTSRIGKERVRASRWMYLACGAAVWALMQAGRMIMSLIFGAPVAEVIRFPLTDSLSLVFTLVILWIVKRLDGVYEDQNRYLERVHREERTKGEDTE
ncbi:MAG: hypothetical protein MJ142_05180 [Clostridia bacterium]|nr:hypothetical protein [Clostridia bacterium]